MGRGQELLDAAREGHSRTVEKILSHLTKRSGPFPSLRRGVGPNLQDDNGYTPLHHACLNGHRDIVRMLLSVEASPCIADKKGATPLHLAAFKGDAQVVEMLLNHNNPPVNVNQLTHDGDSALLVAAPFGFVNVVSQLVARGADVSIQNANGDSALDLAAQYGKINLVKYLLRVRPQLVHKYISKGLEFPSTPLHRASMNGRTDVVLALIEAGMDPNVRTPKGTPLHEAVSYGQVSVVRALLQNGADIYATDSTGKTVLDILDEYPEELRNVSKVIREHMANSASYDTEIEETHPFPVVEYSPTPTKTSEIQKNTNKNYSLLSSSSSSSVTKKHTPSFVKKLASKCLGLKAKFNSAPNIPNSTAAEVDVKSKQLDHRTSTNTLLIGNSKFFKMLSKKEEAGEIVCTDEFDTISLDRLGTLNRDSVVNRSNRSCPGFKTSLPNISENNELSDSQESVPKSIIITQLNCDIHNDNITQAVNYNANFNIFEPRDNNNRKSVISTISSESRHLVNECYESYDVHKNVTQHVITNPLPIPPPRPTVIASTNTNDNNIYENIMLEKRTVPKPAARIHIPVKPLDDEQRKILYENVALIQEMKQPEPLKRTVVPTKSNSSSESKSSSTIGSRSSSMSSESMEDETNLEDILLSEKSKSFRHQKPSLNSYTKLQVSRTQSLASDLSDVTAASALENVDCSGDVDEKLMYLSMTGTLPNKKPENIAKKKVLFRHKTFTNMEADRNSIKIKDLPEWNNAFLKDTLASYHIRGTGHCIYKAPTVQEFIYIFNRDTLHSDVPPFTKVPNNRRDSEFETAICFCKPQSRKFHSSAEDLLDKINQDENEKVSIDIDALHNKREILSSSFKCYCDSGSCALHSTRRDTPMNLVVKFSAIKKSISTPDITLDYSPYSTALKTNLPKNNSVPYNLEEPYAVVSVEDIITRKSNDSENSKDPESPVYVPMSNPSTLSSSTSARPYSIKDIAEVISLNGRSTSTTLSNASGVQLPLRKSSSSEYSGHWSLQSCNSNVTIQSDTSFKTCLEDSSEESDGTLHSDAESSDAETVKSDVSTGKRPWVHSDSFRFGSNTKPDIDVILEEDQNSDDKSQSSKYESGVGLEGSVNSSSECEDDSGIPRNEVDDMSLGCASLERVSGLVGGVRSGSGRRRWDEAEGTSEGDALSVSSAASSNAPLHLAHHHPYSKVSPTPPKKPPRRNLSVSPTHANSPSSGYSYELRPHARSQDDLDDIQGAKHYLKHGRSVDQYVDSKLSYSEYEENHNSPRVAPVPNPRPSLKHRSQPVAITAMYENIVIKEQNPRRKLRRNNLVPSQENEHRIMDRVRKHSHQERSSLESLLDDQSMNSPSDCERYYDGPRGSVPLSPTHYTQPPTPDHPPPSARQAENCIHERIRPLSQLIMEVVEEIRIRKMSQSDITNS